MVCVTREAGFSIEATDGTSIAVFVEGAGPALVMVHGSIADHTTFDSFIDVLGNTFTTYSMDRRGFGVSGDAEEYAIERDFEDVAAVIDEVAARTGGPVALFGHSYGANCAVGGAALSDNVHHLVLYEPSFGLQYPPGSIEAMEDALAAGENERVMVAILTDFVGMTEEEIDGMRSSSVWPARLAAAHTIPRECRAEHSWVHTPGQFDAVTAPTLLLAGSETLAAIAEVTPRVAASLGDARIHVLEGHGHMAHKTDPAMVAGVINEFING
jgi:pimeloyl-ACP methyl ester carboxylesterase